LERKKRDLKDLELKPMKVDSIDGSGGEKFSFFQSSFYLTLIYRRIKRSTHYYVILCVVLSNNRSTEYRFF
jgi:hypothetical protein